VILPMSAPDITDAEIDAVTAVLRSAVLSGGKVTAAFEERFAAYVGTRYAIGVSSGTAGLHMAVVAAGVRDGDLVLTTPFSFVASANVVLYERAVPVFVDIDPSTLNIDPAAAAAAVADLLRGGTAAEPWLPPAWRGGNAAGPLRALLPVHIFGVPLAMDRFVALARAHQLALIEDACEALGAFSGGRHAGTHGDAAVFGFYPNKQMTTGEGGMIVTSRDDWASVLRSLRNQGRDESETWLRHVRLGYNYRMTAMSSALGLVQLGRLDELLAKRDQVARWYAQRLAGVEGVQLPVGPAPAARRSWFVYVVRLGPGIDRDAVIGALQAVGIDVRPYFTPIHLQPFYRERFGYRPGQFPITEAVARSTLAVPFFATMTEPQVEYVCQHLAAAVRQQLVRT